MEGVAPQSTEINGNTPVSNSDPVLYSTDENLNFISIDPATGQVTTIGPIGYSIEGLSFAPDGTLYATSDTAVPFLHGGAETLISIDTATGTGTIIGPIGFNDVDAMAFGPDGTLYGADYYDGRFITIDPATGAGTDVGMLRYPGSSNRLFIGGMVFSADGVLYGSEVPSALGPANLVTIEPATGVLTLIGSIGFETVEGLTFTPDGTLYGVTATVGGYPWYQTADLITIDLATGAGTKVCTLTIEDIDGLAAFHFDPNEPPVADAGPDQTLNEGDVVQLNGSASYDPDGTIISYEWDFDASDGLWWETGDAPDATGPTPTHIYGDNGVFVATLRVTDAQNLTATDACNITVLNVEPEITIQSVEMDLEIGLRVAGRKYNDVGMTLYEDGTPIGYISIERLPGSPDEQMAWVPVSIDFTKSYSAILTYIPEDPPNIGSNPVWIFLRSGNGSIKRIHHTFNVQQSMKRDSEHWNHVEPWEVDLTGNLTGCIFDITTHITDPGSDDETLTLTYGLQTVTKVYLNKPPDPDPFPSPEVNPRDITDTTGLMYEGPGTITVIVEDDDGLVTAGYIDM